MSTDKKNKVLVVEDDHTLNSAYSKILNHEGYDVRSVENGRDALGVLDEFAPDLILLDLRMPLLDGVGFLREAAIPLRFPNTKVIVFTNFDVNEEIDEAFELGAVKYVLKAMVSPKELVKIIAEEIEE